MNRYHVPRLNSRWWLSRSDRGEIFRLRNNRAVKMARLIDACHSDFILPRMVATGQGMVREKKDSLR